MAVALETRQIGSLSVSAIGLGCMNLSHGYFPQQSETSAERLLHHALDQGVTMLDTAALYGFGANEELIGRAVGHRRQEFVLASKCVLAQLDGKRVLDGSPVAIARTLDDALRRLRTDHIDLYYLHRLDRNVPIEESVGALVRAREDGKIGAIGLSEMSAATIRRAHSVHPITAVQSEYSPWSRNPEIAVLDCCEELNIGFVAFSPLGRGLLAGAIGPEGVLADDIRADMPRFQSPHLERNLALFHRLSSLARSFECTPAQLCLAWVLSRGEHIVAIPGTTNVAHLDENIATLRRDIPSQAIADITSIFAKPARFPARAIRPRRNARSTRKSGPKKDSSLFCQGAIA